LLAWWRAIKWRARTADGRLSQLGEGDWEVLRKPGLNGLLSVIVFLKFWADVIEREEDTPAFDETAPAKKK